MLWNFSSENYGGRKLTIGLPKDWGKGEKRPAVILHDGDMIESVCREISEKELIKGELPVLVLIPSVDRMKEYSPWKAPGLNKREGDFGGEGDSYLQELEKVFLPWLMEKWNCDPNRISSCGYSLGGLISLYGIWKQEFWYRAVSLCGSFWYEGWLDYIAEHPILNPETEVFILAGEKESRGRHSLLRTTVDCARKTAEIAEKTNPAEFVLDKGGHHDFLLERYVKAFNWICR